MEFKDYLLSGAGYTLNIFRFASLIAGIGYITWGELEEKNNLK
ncbi:hypothetical protein FIU87_03530 [Bacillus sp. THAF10]|nr:hypothetical protein [Bacillus sp. THAF10]QFT87714.1 hypothetical protein FIU87_03530 [Bacillus sp. THAF10]